MCHGRVKTAHCPATTASEKPSAWQPCCPCTEKGQLIVWQTQRHADSALQAADVSFGGRWGRDGLYGATGQVRGGEGGQTVVHEDVPAFTIYSGITKQAIPTQVTVHRKLQ